MCFSFFVTGSFQNPKLLGTCDWSECGDGSKFKTQGTTEVRLCLVLIIHFQVPNPDPYPCQVLTFIETDSEPVKHQSAPTALPKVSSTYPQKPVYTQMGKSGSSYTRTSLEEQGLKVLHNENSIAYMGL